MAIGPVQLIVLGFDHPKFHGEIIAELERLRESDTVRVIDALAVYKDAEGELEVEHLSNLSQDEAIELGSKVGALIGLGIEGEEGFAAGAAAGAGRGRGRHRGVLRGGGLGCRRGDPERLRRRPRPDRAPLGDPAARRDRPGGRLPDLATASSARSTSSRSGWSPPRRPASCTRSRPAGRAARRPDRALTGTSNPTRRVNDDGIPQSRPAHRAPDRAARQPPVARAAPRAGAVRAAMT